MAMAGVVERRLLRDNSVVVGGLGYPHVAATGSDSSLHKRDYAVPRRSAHSSLRD